MQKKSMHKLLLLFVHQPHYHVYTSHSVQIHAQFSSKGFCNWNASDPEIKVFHPGPWFQTPRVCSSSSPAELLPDWCGVVHPPSPQQVFVAVPDGFCEGGVVGEQGLSAGTGVSEEVLFSGRVNSLK